MLHTENYVKLTISRSSKILTLKKLMKLNLPLQSTITRRSNMSKNYLTSSFEPRRNVMINELLLITEY